MSEVSLVREKKIQTKEKIILALDVETVKEAREVLAEVRGEVGAFKIGLQLFTVAGASFVREVVAAGGKVFLDLKYHDIPNTVAKAALEAARLGVWMFDVHALGGGEMMRKTVTEVRVFCDSENLEQPKIIAVTVLTSSVGETLREVGIEGEVENEVLNLARLSAKCGLDGVVASPKEIRLIRENIKNKDFLIVTPGIRGSIMGERSAGTDNQFETNDDQKRVMNPKEAVESGSDYLVIGRPILRATDKISAIRQIIKEIEAR